MLRGLFPKWDANEYEARLYRKAFKSRRADLMQTAIEDFRTYHKYQQPNLGGILKDSSGVKQDTPQFDEEADAREVGKSRARILLDLELMPDDVLARVKAEIGSIGCLSGIIAGVRGPVGEWTDTARGLVWAKAEEMGLIAGSSLSTQPPSPSPDPG